MKKYKVPASVKPVRSAKSAYYTKAGAHRVSVPKPSLTTAPVSEKMSKPELLVECAIIRGDETHHGFKSHSELRSSLGDEDPYQQKPDDVSGFWTSHGRFVSRKQAVHVGVRSGQLREEWLKVQRDLLSSDVW